MTKYLIHCLGCQDIKKAEKHWIHALETCQSGLFLGLVENLKHFIDHNIVQGKAR